MDAQIITLAVSLYESNCRALSIPSAPAFHELTTALMKNWIATAQQIVRESNG
jgi:hypothetical protein